ncbi:hypothetical protein OPV22_013029 [Ensete ventricosum]|uniref:Uncharacterized protein n=1 Tax=Ensete ventricosum TaxID=4639 RepID=A0AAV8R6I4_ENSVE|nr:hypothetical protein OPV22_013029 [Ensete ventricosum]
MPKPAPAPDVGDDDDDFITNEVKRRLKELRKNSFMVLIPEEGHPGEEEEGNSSGWGGDSEAGDGYSWCGFDTFYAEYCERMLFFDRLISRHFEEAGLRSTSRRSLRSVLSKLGLALRKLRFKKKQDEHPDNRKQLQLPQQEDERCRNLEAAFVAQPEDGVSYGYAAQLFQQFQILLQRFIENEPFEQGSKVEVYAHGRSWLSKLLQVPNFLAHLVKIMEDSILTLRLFLRMDKKRRGSFFGPHSPRSSLRQVQASLDRKEMRVKELFKKKKGWRKKKRTWPTTLEEVELLFALIDIEVISRVLRMARLSKEQLLWCEEKMSKLDLSGNRLCRDGSLLLFPLLTVRFAYFPPVLYNYNKCQTIYQALICKMQ